MTTGVQCRNDPRCTCRYHQAIREAARWRQWLARRLPTRQASHQLLSASQASCQAEPEAEAG
jgi:hypothetical protein